MMWQCPLEGVAEQDRPSFLEPCGWPRKGTQDLRHITIRSHAPLTSGFSPNSNDIWEVSEVLENKEIEKPSDGTWGALARHIITGAG